VDRKCKRGQKRSAREERGNREFGYRESEHIKPEKINRHRPSPDPPKTSAKGCGGGRQLETFAKKKKPFPCALWRCGKLTEECLLSWARGKQRNMGLKKSHRLLEVGAGGKNPRRV